MKELTDSELSALHGDCDVNKDGQITLIEFTNAVAEYYQVRTRVTSLRAWPRRRPFPSLPSLPPPNFQFYFPEKYQAILERKKMDEIRRTPSGSAI